MDVYKYFPIKVLAVTALGLLVVFAINAYIDPLWYFGGNRYSGNNYAFNDRVSKLDLYLQAPASYDCIIFGASSASILDADLVKGHHCFNFSYRRGIVREYIDYEKYIKSLGFSPSLIIVAADLYNFQVQDPEDQSPEYVKNLTAPPSSLELYLSWHPLLYSLKTLFGFLDPGPIFYDKNFKGVMLPPKAKIPPDWRKHLTGEIATFYSTSVPVTDENVKYFKELRDVFGQATYIGFTLPRTVQMTEDMKAEGTFGSSLKVTYELSKIFDRFYDFSLPLHSGEATDTYDGYHYGSDTARRMIEEINGDTQNDFLHVNELTFDEYQYEYNHRLDELIKNKNAAPPAG